ncbi:MAG TPA: FYDLN acid domain-containing protein [Myxococcaceae bacterium]|nr:FYDLN acid domain-containing protein [Myxococcaceae bacterium]
MPAKDLGNKFVCFKCETKFYDLKKPDPICPKCGADQRESPALRPGAESKRSRAAAVKAVPAPVLDRDEEETEEDDDDLLDDASDDEEEELGDDDDL